MVEYFDREGKPLTTEKWAKKFDDERYRILATFNVGPLLVSTIWLGLDHRIQFLDPGPPLIFESMIFEIPSGNGEPWRSLETQRYSTEAAALAGHDSLVNIAKVMVEIDEEFNKLDP